MAHHIHLPKANKHSHVPAYKGNTSVNLNGLVTQCTIDMWPTLSHPMVQVTPKIASITSKSPHSDQGRLQTFCDTHSDTPGLALFHVVSFAVMFSPGFWLLLWSLCVSSEPLA